MSRAQTAIIAVLLTLLIGVGATAGWLWWDARDTRDYPDSVRDAFLVSCAGFSRGASTEDFCGCTLDEVEDRAELSRYLAIEQALLSGGPMPRLLVQAARSCDENWVDPLSGGDAAAPPGDPTDSDPVANIDPPDSTDPDAHYATDELSWVFLDPEPGRWVTTDGAACRWELLDLAGQVYNGSSGAEILIDPAGTAALRTESGCRWVPA